MTPTFTIVMGTINRGSLIDSLTSIAKQERVPGDQCLVGIDIHGDTDHVRESHATALVKSFGEGFIPLAHLGISDKHAVHPYTNEVIKPGDPYGWLGVEQINECMRKIPMTGSHVFTIGDDDIFVNGAYRVIRKVCQWYPGHPVIYRFQAPPRIILWDKPRMRACLISGCCIAAPIEYVGMHPTDLETTHDYRWMMDIIGKANAAGKPPVWLDYVGVIARPTSKAEWEGIWTCPDWRNCKAWYYVSQGMLAKCRCGRDLWSEDQPRIVEEVLDEN